MKKSRLLGVVCTVLIGLISPAGLLAANGYTIIDLGTLGGTISVGRDINNAGQVAGYSYNSSAEWHAFLGVRNLLTTTMLPARQTASRRSFPGRSF